MSSLIVANTLITVLFLICYAYQLLYIPVPWIKKEKKQGKPLALHDYAILICARNEAVVIADLIESLKQQTYPAEHIHIFVMADNCTDDTAEIAMRCGATVYVRFNSRQIGKGYALDALLSHIRDDYPQGFDGYIVFDADNILANDYIEQMNKTFCDGNEIITGYRNSKNYGDNWISAGYALWFLRESRYLNHARHLLGTSCAVSGTGFLFSRRIAEELDGWPYHMLTEDIEFTIDQITRGRRIAFCSQAVLYDEQPTSFRQSVRQRMRWSRGFLQVLHGYWKRLICGMGTGSFSCFDMSMVFFPPIFSPLCPSSLVLRLVSRVLCWAKASCQSFALPRPSS